MARISTTDLLWLEQMLEEEELIRLAINRRNAQPRSQAEQSCQHILTVVKQELWVRSANLESREGRENE
jgi:hypothetical protein